MSVVGIDFGNEKCIVAIARAGGIETVDNDYSLRATPSYVAFGEKQRILGVAAKNQTVTNVKNTIHGFKRFLGRKMNDPFIQGKLPSLPFDVVSIKNGCTAYNVNFLKEPHIFTPEQITAMLFTKLKETTESSLAAKVHDCVISVPSYFTDTERRSLLDAAQMAGLNTLRLLNDSTATALSYGIYKQDLPLPEETPRNVVFIDCGHSALQAYTCAFNKGKLKILSCSSDPHLGGSDFDQILAAHFCSEFKKKYEIDAYKNPRALIRLDTEVEKLKKQMSANSTKLPLSIDCFVDNKDVASSICRADFESMCSNLFERVESILKKCLLDSKLKLEDIHSVEIVGGSTRIPGIKKLIEKTFNQNPSTTLNQDEAVARGCALQCALLSPSFKVRDFSITDVQPYAIQLLWDQSAGDKGTVEIFPEFHPVPFSRMVTLHNKEPFSITAVYTTSIPFPEKQIGTFTINEVKPTRDGENSKVRIKARVNMNGIFSISKAVLYEKVELDPDGEENMEAEMTSNAGQETTRIPDSQEMKSDDGNNTEESPGVDEDVIEVKVEKKATVTTRELPIEALTVGLSRRELDLAIENESKMISQDRMEKERIDSKNALEEYLYDFRDKLDGGMKKFVEKDVFAKITQDLSNLEEWLYEGGLNENKSVYTKRLEELKKMCEPIKELKKDAEDRPQALKLFDDALRFAKQAFDSFKSKDPKYDHLEPCDIEKMEKAVRENEHWKNGALTVLSDVKDHMPSPINVSSINDQRKVLENIVKSVLTTPKPKVEPPKEAEEVEILTEIDNGNVSEKAESAETPSAMDID